jgi:hypothetical protein
MTILDAPRPVASRPRHLRPLDVQASAARLRQQRRASRRATVGFGLAVGLLALVARLVAIWPAYDLFGDEVDYVDLGVSFRQGHFPPQFAHNPFLLHPPLFFALSSAWEFLVGTGGPYFHLVTEVRALNAIFGTITAVLLYDLGRRSVGRSAGLAAGVLFALDAYVLRQNGRDLLETTTLAFVLAGYWVLLRLFQPKGGGVARSLRRMRTIAVAGGLLLGLSTLDKDMTFALILAPLAVVWWREWGLSRDMARLVVVAALTPYVLYLLALVAVGQFGSFFSQETVGLQRMLGLKKESGFSRAGSPSLVHTMVAQLTSFGVTYLVCGLGFLAALYLLRVSRRNDQRLLALVTLSASLTLVYAVLFGTIEEQFLYFMMVPAILSVASAAVLAVGSIPGPIRRGRWSRRIAVLLAITLVYDGGLWVQTRASADNGAQRVVEWFAAHDPHPGLIGDDTEAITYALQHYGYGAVNIPAPADAQRLKVRYLTVLSKQVAGNYGYLDADQAAFYERYGQLVFSFHESTYGDVQIYRTTNTTIW